MLNTRPKIGSWLLCLAFANCSYAADLIRITPENYQQIVPAGKETDAIHGDWLLRNDKLSVVIAQPQPGRKANMTVRGVSGMIIDFTRRHHPSDQLSCFYPAAGRYLFEESDRYEVKLGDEWVGLNSKVQFSAKKLELRMVGRPVADDGTEATVVYSLADGEESLRYRVQLTNKSETGRKLAIEDSIRCDGNLFEMASVPEQRLFYAVDRYFGQGYGFILDEGTISDGGGRNRVMRSSLSSSEEVASGESVAWSGQMRCSQGLPGLLSWAEAEASSSTNRIYPMQLKLQSPFGPVQHASVEFQKQGKPLGVIQSNEEGWVRTELLPGEYSVKIQAPGLAPRVHEFVIEQSPHSESLTMPACSLVRASIVDDLDRPIAAKVQFIGIGDTPTPDFGPDSAISAIKNCVYSAHGQFEQPIDPGKYQVIVSHGTEYDAAFLEIEVKEGQIYALHAALARPVSRCHKPLAAQT